MNQNKIVLSISVALGLLLGLILVVWNQSENSDASAIQTELLERDYSPSFGPDDAKVTIVEFFDPACEACRAFYPLVKKILNQNPEDVRLVLRYTAFHQGSGEVVLLLEASHRQGLYKEVLEGLLARQNSWASHHAPNIANAWSIAESVGLDIERAKEDIKDPSILKILEQDTSDVKSLGVEKTPTFFVNGKPLETFGLQQLIDLVQEELKS